MTTLRQSRQVAARLPASNATSANEAVTQVTDYVVEAGLALNDVIEMGCLPGYCLPVDVKVFAEDADSNGTPTITLDAGIITGTYGKVDNTRTCGNEFFAASNVAQAGGLAPIAKKDARAHLGGQRGEGLRPEGRCRAAATLTVGARIVMVVTYMPSQPLMPVSLSA
jgi:hypothetical protein